MAAVLHSRLTHPSPVGASRRMGLVAAIGFHVAVVAGLLSFEPTRSALFAAAPIMVEFITPPKPPEPKPPEAKPVPPPTALPKPKPVAKVIQPPRPAEPPALIAAPAEAPSPVVAPSAPPAPAAPAAEAIAAAPAGPVAITPPVFNADYLENPAPAYPPLSRRMREQGRVMLRVLVNARGTAEDVQIRTSSGISRLDEAAQETVRRWKFVPAKRGSEAVSAWVLIPISFRLEG